MNPAKCNDIKLENPGIWCAAQCCEDYCRNPSSEGKLESEYIRKKVQQLDSEPRGATGFQLPDLVMVWFGLLGFNASATARVISRR